MSQTAIDIDMLSPSERWELIERLWASLTDADFELSPAQMAELDKRLADLDEDVTEGRPLGRPWDRVKASLFREG